VSRLKLAVIGAGHLGRIHARLASANPEMELVAVVDPDEAARNSVAEEFSATPLANHNELNQIIDAAIVASPTCTHHTVAADLLERGIHLFIEKPLTIDSSQARQLVQAASSRRLTLQVGHVERFNPAFRAVERFASCPKYIEAVRTSSYTFRSTDIGVVLDLMIHDLDVVLSLVQSELVSTHAIGISVFGEHEDMAQARLHFLNGCVVNLTASRSSFISQRTMQIFTETGYASVDFANHQAKIIRPNEKLTKREINFALLTPDQKQFVQDTLFEEYLRLEEIPVKASNAIQDEQQDFIESVHEGRQPRVCGQQGLETITIAEQILDSIASHRWTSIAAGPSGAMTTPDPIILPGPQPANKPDTRSTPRRKAG